MISELVFATRNRGKLAELEALLREAGLPIAVHGLDALGVAGEVEETGATFVENAALKAHAALGATGLPALADDSGLEVDALGGAPGVRSARYAGEPSSDARNNERLLHELRDVPPPRTARFRCALVLALPSREPPLVAEGTCEGEIIATPRGSGGFGYDPLFIPAEGDGRTMAELSFAEKNRLSHRARAMSRLLALLTQRRGSI